MDDFILVKTVFLKAPIDRVWAYLTEPDKLGEWFHQGKHELEVGGPWVVLGDDGQAVCRGEVLEMQFKSGDQTALYIHTFTHDMLENTVTKVKWELETVDGGTVATLTHSGFGAYPNGAFDMTANHDEGWDDHFTRLRKVVLS